MNQPLLTKCPQRTSVIGTSGSGKTTLAQRLAQRLDISHIELDALHWNPNWTPTPRETFRERVARALQGETWTTDGNYSVVRDIVWKRADTVVWLDYPLPIIMWRVTWRTIRRAISRKELWSGNQENLQMAFFDRESIIWFALRTYHRRRKEYPRLFSKPEHRHLNVVHLQSPQATHKWLESIPITNESKDESGMTSSEPV
ncbi:MAG: AAA family ATPase [Anaerolineae bacterium]|jgi:adenylate kinase family enzyme